MLKELHIRNFKCWEDTGSIQMAPITVFFGANSSGKSSIGHLLLLLKQTAASQDQKAVFFPGDKNSLVQLGLYRDFVFQHEESGKISFGYRWTTPLPLEFKDAISGRVFSGEELSFQAEVRCSSSSILLHSMEYQLIKASEAQMGVGMKEKPSNGQEYLVEAQQYDLVRTKGRPWGFKGARRFYGFPDEAVAYYQNADFLQELNLAHEQMLESIGYLGPLRVRPERVYAWTGTGPDNVGSSGEKTVAALLSAQNRKIAFKRRSVRQTMRSTNKKNLDVVAAKMLKEMGLVKEFAVERISGSNQMFEVKILTPGSDRWVGLPDAGFGISQVLPVLVQSLYAPRHSILLMEQPEIHLHPSAQSALADVMIDVIHSREEGKDRNIQLLIETHSEHFLRRLQRRIAEDKLLADQVRAYFVDASAQSSRLVPLNLDEYGNIDNWPKGFFGDSMGEIAAHSLAALRKRKRKRPVSTND